MTAYRLTPKQELAVNILAEQMCLAFTGLHLVDERVAPERRAKYQAVATEQMFELAKDDRL